MRDPDGRTWRVSRRWVPWRRRMRGATESTPPGASTFDGGGDDPLSMVLWVLGLIIIVPSLVVLAIAGIELVALALLLPFVVLGRAALGRHWHVEVRRGWEPVWEIDAGSWRTSQERIFAIAAAIERGELPPVAVEPARPQR